MSAPTIEGQGGVEIVRWHALVAGVTYWARWPVQSSGISRRRWWSAVRRGQRSVLRDSRWVLPISIRLVPSIALDRLGMRLGCCCTGSPHSGEAAAGGVLCVVVVHRLGRGWVPGLWSGHQRSGSHQRTPPSHVLIWPLDLDRACTVWSRHFKSGTFIRDPTSPVAYLFTVSPI
jgi:hypothetical protein